ncbi:MAG: hypothetical protein LBP21_08590 [Synergistaceae bacterium]|jgi:hypothetical protein|nr:hypothetical protein [Synergistaceae bacterium]
MKRDGIFSSKRRLFRQRASVALILMIFFAAVFMWAGVASAVVHVVKEGRIEGIPGFRFENLVYDWDKIFIDVVNMTNRNTTFGGTMVFLDRRGNSVASARLLPAKVAHESVRRYKGHFLEGTGETARRAARIFWDFGPR